MKDTKKGVLPPINENIRADKVQLILHTGENVGIVPRSEAAARAEAVELDLVLIAEEGSDGVPVVKIMDYGKVLYEKKKKQIEAKKHQKVIQVKELKLRPKIGEHDYETKMNRAVEFLEEGKHLKVTLEFRGRENLTKDERGKEMFDKVEATLHEHGLSSHLLMDKESRAGKAWTRVYYLKSGFAKKS